MTTVMAMGVTDCPLILSSYIDTWSGYFTAILPALFALYIIVAAVNAVRVLLHILRQPKTVFRRTSSLRSYLVSLFAHGILNPKLFSIA